MKKYAIIITLAAAVVIALFYKHFYVNKENQLYAVEHYIPAEQYDTLLVDMVTYMGVKPRNTNHLTRHEPQHRDFYINQAQNYFLHSYYIADDDSHYYYMIRPARHHQYEHRAIGGKMKVDEAWRITEFEEIFATKPMSLHSLKELAANLFPEMVQDHEQIPYNVMQWIEWPDDRCRYDKQKNEWRYDVVE